MTHPSADHVTGLVEVLNRYQVKQVLHPDLDFESDIYLTYDKTNKKHSTIEFTTDGERLWVKVER